MFSLVHSSNFEEEVTFRCVDRDLATETSSCSFFRSIPPERLGLNGEYDHSGLAKRVYQAFRKQVPSEQLEQLRVTQRGQVVILTGRLPNQKILAQLVEIALQMVGASAVETYGVITPDSPASSPTILS